MARINENTIKHHIYTLIIKKKKNDAFELLRVATHEFYLKSPNNIS